MNDLRALQKKLLEVMIIFHKICQENDIKYYMLGGTQLGAVRHKGFIPWDDDIDVGIPREDYEKFIKISSENLPNGIELAHYKKDKKFPYGFSKLYDTKTTLVEENNTKEGIIGGIYIDVFPLDGIGNTYKEAHKNFQKIDFLRRVLYYNTAKVKTKNPIKKLANICFRFLNTYKIISKINNKAEKYDFNSSDYVVNTYGAWRFKEISKKDVFGNPTLYDFEGHKFYGVEKYDEYLTSLYGNYNELPPEEKRKSHHHIRYLNLNLPYKDYIRNLEKN